METETIHLPNGKRKRKKMTAIQLAEKEGRKTDAIRKRFNDVWPERKFRATAELTPEEIVLLSKEKGSVKTEGRKASGDAVSETGVLVTKQSAGPKAVPSAVKKTPLFFLYMVLVSATVASVYNLLMVSFEIADFISAVVLTVVLSLAAVVFVAVGVRHQFTRYLVGFLIAYEGVCNMVRIYGGLTHWQDGVPTNFLATVCDVFGTGTYITAKAAGFLTALMIAGVQYASIFEINKR